MKNLIVCIILLFIIVILWCLTSCTKDYVQNPTCFRYLELLDKYDGELIYLRTDTVYPNGRLSNVACGDNLKKIEDYKPRLEGCENGWQEIRYEILK